LAVALVLVNPEEIDCESFDEYTIVLNFPILPCVVDREFCVRTIPFVPLANEYENNK
jgi:hypothetical protein